VGGSINVLSAGFKFGIGLENGGLYFTSGKGKIFGYDFHMKIKLV